MTTDETTFTKVIVKKDDLCGIFTKVFRKVARSNFILDFFSKALDEMILQGVRVPFCARSELLESSCVFRSRRMTLLQARELTLGSGNGVRIAKGCAKFFEKRVTII